MKKYLFFLITLFSINCYSQNFSSKIIGSWILKGYVGKKSVIECPDVLVFEKNAYSILNDCYGEDSELPIIEKGKWTFNTKDNNIILTQRKFISNYNFNGNIKTLTMYIKEKNDRMMKVCFNNMNSTTIAVFEKKR
ncbi:hypothetical protein GCM10027049_03080 [Mucilaginibacter puniceus]